MHRGRGRVHERGHHVDGPTWDHHACGGCRLRHGCQSLGVSRWHRESRLRLCRGISGRTKRSPFLRWKSHRHHRRRSLQR
ncbi:hypothetical protein RSSM_04031 [Rhodopirellula sallentina SM41]|uniref:Uncharacterized protein n=1 Tax=Rhodopirellula sallentina SM41 TaxID=1263870 RepID=M5TZD1_9BACT|nr:hypothetical protein RSSM_04031 [Rhodopirellula sallentina SM41]